MTDQPLTGLSPAATVDIGVIAGLARKAYRKAPMEVLERAEITEAGGITGDHRGQRKPNGTGKRQVTLMERSDWADACAQVGVELPWWERRCNVAVDGFDLPQVPGVLLRLGRDVVLEVTRFTHPCERMEVLAPGLFEALLVDWRGGVCSRVRQGGTVLVGDVIRLEGLA
ncbi:MOSC domain-containing protein [uncultured Sphingomonas sp.]|uniref:MOSC domain-containing protein n=1 Tax=uncultured Sphingomonas sp. TaxID=158754 RepID=UPI0035C97547